MRELILLRHAHADGHADGQADAERPLSAVGRTEAAAAAAWLHGRGLQPDRALCSPARRTRETLDVVAAGFEPFEVRFEPSIYEATPGTLAGLVDAHRDAGRLLLVGHNPGLERLLSLMHSGQTSEYRGMPPAGIAVLAFAAGSAIEPGVATLSAFWWP